MKVSEGFLVYRVPSFLLLSHFFLRGKNVELCKLFLLVAVIICLYCNMHNFQFLTLYFDYVGENSAHSSTFIFSSSFPQF